MSKNQQSLEILSSNTSGERRKSGIGVTIQSDGKCENKIASDDSIAMKKVDMRRFDAVTTKVKKDAGRKTTCLSDLKALVNLTGKLQSFIEMFKDYSNLSDPTTQIKMCFGWTANGIRLFLDFYSIQPQFSCCILDNFKALLFETI